MTPWSIVRLLNSNHGWKEGGTPMGLVQPVYTNDTSIEGIKTQNKHTLGFVQTVKYTEVDETTHIQYQ